jgi:hypothetical protein
MWGGLPTVPLGRPKVSKDWETFGRASVRVGRPAHIPRVAGIESTAHASTRGIKIPSVAVESRLKPTGEIGGNVMNTQRCLGLILASAALISANATAPTDRGTDPDEITLEGFLERYSDGGDNPWPNLNDASLTQEERAKKIGIVLGVLKERIDGLDLGKVEVETLLRDLRRIRLTILGGRGTINYCIYDTINRIELYALSKYLFGHLVDVSWIKERSKEVQYILLTKDLERLGVQSQVSDGKLGVFESGVHIPEVTNLFSDVEAWGSERFPSQEEQKSGLVALTPKNAEGWLYNSLVITRDFRATVLESLIKLLEEKVNIGEVAKLKDEELQDGWEEKYPSIDWEYHGGTELLVISHAAGVFEKDFDTICSLDVLFGSGESDLKDGKP